jgi:catechol 2,3-dioxygenase-like lactoylglutathione lyase family enzyme
MNTTSFAAAVHSVHRFTFTVPDLAEAERFYTCFGLDVRREGERLHLRTFGHPHVWAHVLEGGERKRLQCVAYGIHADDVSTFAERIAAQGCQAEPHPLAQEPGLWLRDPDGLALQLVVAPKVSPSAPTASRQVVRVPPGQGQAAPRSRLGPVRPRYLSHILQFTPDVLGMLAFCSSMLGLRLSDRSGDVIAFLHTPHGSDHHLVAFAKSDGPGLHHSSWDVPGLDEVGQGMDQMRSAGYGEGWGVGRHVLGSNYFNYVQDPWGSFCEYSAGIDHVPAGLDWPAADHPAEDALFVWGPPVPTHFITNQETP